MQNAGQVARPASLPISCAQLGSATASPPPPSLAQTSMPRHVVIPRERVQAQMKCDTRMVRWQSCISNPGIEEVVHLKVGNRTWVHSEQMGRSRFAAVLNGSMSVSAGMLATADALLEQGAWSEAVQHARVALTKPRLHPGSYVSLSPAPSAPPHRRGSAASRLARRGWLRLGSKDRASTVDVEQLVFFASSTALHRTDATLLKHYASQLQSKSQLWLLLLTTDEAPPAFDSMDRPVVVSMRQHPTFLWTERALQTTFAPLAAAVRNSLQGMARERISNHARYYYYHSSLLLWFRHSGETYPNVRFFWRLEPDAVYTGNMQTLLNISAAITADVLLPEYLRHTSSPSYPHWANNLEFLSRVPKAKWAWSLVSIGRYSRRYITDIMPRSWTSMGVAYEEISIPVSCLMETGCTLASFRKGSPLGAHIRYQPVYRCQEALRARMRCENEIWHPVKDRECLIDFLEEANSPRYACAGAGVTYRTDVVVGLPRLQADGQWVVDHSTDPRLPRKIEGVVPYGLWVGENGSQVPTAWGAESRRRREEWIRKSVAWAQHQQQRMRDLQQEQNRSSAEKERLFKAYWARKKKKLMNYLCQKRNRSKGFQQSESVK